MFPLRLSSLRIKSRYAAYTFSPPPRFFLHSSPLPRHPSKTSNVKSRERSFEKQKFSNYLAVLFIIFNAKKPVRCKILIDVIIVRAISSTQKERENIYIYIYIHDKQYALQHFLDVWHIVRERERERERIGVVNGKNGAQKARRKNRDGGGFGWRQIYRRGIIKYAAKHDAVFAREQRDKSWLKLAPTA